MSKYDALIAELCYHVRQLGREAAQGDEEARRWMVEAFPGNVDHLLELWPENYQRQPAQTIGGLNECAQRKAC